MLFYQSDDCRDNDEISFYFNIETCKETPYFLNVLRLWVMEIEQNNNIIDLDFDEFNMNLNELIRKNGKNMWNTGIRQSTRFNFSLYIRTKIIFISTI